MVNTQEQKYNRKEIYDPTSATYVREMKATSIYNAFKSGTVPASGTTIAATTVVDTRSILYPYSFTLMHGSTDSVIGSAYLVVNGTTKYAIGSGINGVFSVNQDNSTPIISVGPGATLAVVVNGTSNDKYVVSMVGKIEPRAIYVDNL